MEVPFISSGAISREHYSLVCKVENSSSPQSANQHLSNEVEAIRCQLANPSLSLEDCKKCLISLLFCYLNVSHGFLPPTAFHFALSHAVTLAEAGRTITQKRIGYLFCAEVMPPSHELQLMLVNTLRKDLEHKDIPRICLALDNVITSSNEDLFPAIQTRLYDLLSHPSPHIRRRALLGYRSFASHHTDQLSSLGRIIISGCDDPETEVSGASLALYIRLSQVEKTIQSPQEFLNNLFTIAVSRSQPLHSESVVKILSALLHAGLLEDNISFVLNLIRSCSYPKARDRAVLKGSFALLTNISLERFVPFNPESPIHCIRSLLTSDDPNDIYLFLSCILCVDPILWAGTSSQVPNVLDAWEVERIMQLLESPDSFIRKMTLRLLNRVDTTIVSSYYSQALQRIPPDLSIDALNTCALRMIDALQAQSGDDGELYARGLKELLLRLEQTSLGPRIVLESVIDTILTHLRHAELDFTVGFSTTMLMFVVEPDEQPSQTAMTIIAALTTEQCGKLSVSPLDVLKGFASKLTTCIPSVQDVSLLAMLRVAAECEEIPTFVVDTVTNLGEHSRKHLRQRCDQFVSLVADRPRLLDLVRGARSSTLPDFLVALETPNVQPGHPSTSTSSQSLSASKLRYHAYDTPIQAPKLRNRDISRSPQLGGHTQWETLSDAGPGSLNRISSNLSVSSAAHSLTKTLTPGELTLAASQERLDLIKTDISRKEIPEVHVVDDLASRVDLITLDSPFVTEPIETRAEAEDFETIWNSLESGEARGWFTGSVQAVMERMQTLEHTRLQVLPMDNPGDTKVMVFPAHGQGGRRQAVLQLKASEDDSCLWRLRCGDDELRSRIKGLLG